MVSVAQFNSIQPFTYHFITCAPNQKLPKIIAIIQRQQQQGVGSLLGMAPPSPLLCRMWFFGYETPPFRWHSCSITSTKKRACDYPRLQELKRLASGAH